MASILHDPALYVTLLAIDTEEAAKTRAAGCRFCGGTLHRSAYPRKPRAPVPLGAADCVRESFCCAEEGCRRRTTPSSVRFLGRRVYAAAVVVLATAFAHGVTARRARQLRQTLDVSRRTLERWRRWWREAVPRTRFWRAAGGRLMPPVDETALPASLVERYGEETVDRVAALLRFLRALPEG